LRKELADVLVNPYVRGASPGLIDIRKISVAIHAESKKLAVERGLGAEWDLQSLLSLVGVGLVHLGRNLSPETKDWCFYLAGAAADAYLRKLPVVDPLKTVIPRSISASSESTAGSLVDRTTELVSLRKRLTSGPGGVVTLRGVRGIGKTSLLNAVL